MSEDHFDLMVHLAGEQIVPNYLAARQVEAGQHVLVVSERTQAVHDRLNNCGLSLLDPVRVEDPYDVVQCADAIGYALSSGKRGNIVFNVTGGTKPMFAAALTAAYEFDAPCFYVETEGHRLLWLRGRSGVQPLKPVMDVEMFIHFAGYPLHEAGHWEDDPIREQRAEITKFVWQNNRGFSKALKNLADAANAIDKGKEAVPEINKGKFSAWQGKDGRCGFRLGGRTFECPGWRDVFRYFAGGYLEEYVYLLLKPLLENEELKDLRIGLRPDWRSRRDSSQGIQEFDVACTDGLRLFILECKAGGVTQGDIQKLENNARTFGGTFGMGILVTAFGPNNPTIIERVKNSRTVALFSGYSVTKDLPEQLLNVSAGMIFGVSDTPARRSRTKRKR